MSFPPAQPLRLVIFDCDGVLVDSEGPASRAMADEVTRIGWTMDAAEAMRQFIGMTLEQTVPPIEARIGRAVPAGWVEQVRARVIGVMSREVEAMPDVHLALDAVAALGLPHRVASNSSHREMAIKFARTGLSALLERAHSADDVPRGKPAPDVYLAAAAAEGVPPAACLVIEDSVPGAMAAAAAGMACVGLALHGDGAALRAAGAHVIRGFAELPSLLRIAAGVPA